jgi:hypothetical protein
VTSGTLTVRGSAAFVMSHEDVSRLAGAARIAAGSTH